MDCGSYSVPQGLNKSCNGVKEKIINFVITDADHEGFAPISGQTLDDVNAIASWTSLANTGVAYRFKAFAQDASKEGGDAVTLENTSNGGTYHVRYNLPSFTLGIESNNCDFEHLKKTFKPGRTFRVWEETKSSLFGWSQIESGVQVLRGYEAEIVVNPNSAVTEDSTAGFEIKITYKDQDELNASVVVSKPAKFGTQFEAALPIGLSLQIIDISTPASAIVLVKSRCGDAETGLADETFYVDGVALTDGDVTDSGGQYTLDLSSASTLQVKVGSGTFTKLSNIVYDIGDLL